MSIIEIENDWGLVHRYEFATLPAQRRRPLILSKMEGIASRAGIYAALSALWCNGSTADSESACLGSNPSEAAMRGSGKERFVKSNRCAFGTLRASR